MNGKMGRLRALKEAASTSRGKFRPARCERSEAIQEPEAQHQIWIATARCVPRDDGATGQTPCEVYYGLDICSSSKVGPARPFA
jgi:hypothetical protein